MLFSMARTLTLDALNKDFGETLFTLWLSQLLGGIARSEHHTITRSEIIPIHLATSDHHSTKYHKQSDRANQQGEVF